MALVYRSWLVALLLPQLLQAKKPTTQFCSPDRKEGEVELIPNTTWVSICENNIVKLICDENWTKEDAQVVCRALGEPTSGAKNLTTYQQGNDYDKTVMVPECNGTEANLTDCKWSEASDCESRPVVGVECLNRSVSSTSASTTIPSTFILSTNPTTSVPPQTTSSYSSSISAPSSSPSPSAPPSPLPSASPSLLSSASPSLLSSAPPTSSYSSSISVPSPSPSAPPTISTTDAGDSILESYYFGLIAAGCVFLFIILTLVALLVVCRRRHRKDPIEKNIPNPLFNEPVYSDPLDSVSIKLTSPVTGVPPPDPLYHTLNPTKPTKPVTDTEGIYSEVQDIIRTKTLPASMMNRPLPPPITSRSSSTLPPHVCKRGPENVSASATAISEAAAPYELPATSSRGRSISDGSRQSEQRDLYASLDESRKYATLEPYMGQSHTPQASEAPRIPCSNEEGTYAHLNHQATPPSTPGSASDATSTNSEGEHAKLMGKDSQHLHSTKETKEELGSWW